MDVLADLFDKIKYVLNDKSKLPIFLSIAIVLLTIVHYFFKNRGLPPGPYGLPYIGYWPFLKEKETHKQFEALQKKYGNLFSFTVTGRLCINLCTAKLVREAHIAKSDCFGARVEEFCLLNYVFGEGFAFANGDQWKVSRKFFLDHLKERNSLSNKENVNEAMYDSIKAAVDELRLANGEPVKITSIVMGKCNTVLGQFLFASGEVSEQQIKDINDAYAFVMNSMSAPSLLLAGSFVRYFLFLFVKGYRSMIKNHYLIEKIIFQIIDDHKASYREDHMRDVIDCFIKERNSRQAKGDPTAKLFTDRCLMASLYQFIGDGVLAVTAFVTIYLKMMADLPEEQEKIFQEVSEVVGLDRQPTVEDKTKLPYTNAFIQELLRTSNFFPFFPSLQCTKETTISGYRIPKGAITVMNIWLAHNDPNVYENPEKFDPSRFLPKEGKPRPELPITFGIGKRACVGESYTMTQVFLYLVTFVQNFKLTYPGAQDVPIDILLSGNLVLCATPRTRQ